MKITLQAIWISVFVFFSVGCIAQSRVDSTKKVYSVTGYLLFSGEDLIVFLPSTHTSHYSLRKLENINGKQIRGDYSSIMQVARTKTHKYIVCQHVYSKRDNKKYDRKIELNIVLVKLFYQEIDILDMAKDNGFGYKYNNKEYSINYVDDWNVSITDIKFLN